MTAEELRAAAAAVKAWDGETGGIFKPGKSMILLANAGEALARVLDWYKLEPDQYPPHLPFSAHYGYEQAQADVADIIDGKELEK